MKKFRKFVAMLVCMAMVMTIGVVMWPHTAMAESISNTKYVTMTIGETVLLGYSGSNPAQYYRRDTWTSYSDAITIGRYYDAEKRYITANRAVTNAKLTISYEYSYTDNWNIPWNSGLCTYYITVVQGAPFVTTEEPGEITGTSADFMITVTSDGGADVTLYGAELENLDTGESWSNEVPVSVNVGTTYGITWTDLVPGTNYRYRMYADNSEGRGYGDWVKFSTLTVPTVTTEEPGEITGTSADFMITVTDDGGADVTLYGVNLENLDTGEWWYREFSIDVNVGTTYGITWTDLVPGTRYRYRMYADNSEGRGYGDWVEFSTLAKNVNDLWPSMYTDVLDDGSVQITLGVDDDDAQIYYSVVKGAYGEFDYTEPNILYTGPFTISEKGEYIVYVVLYLNGEYGEILQSNSFEVDPVAVAVTGITLSQATASLTKGESLTLTATVTPENATNKEVEWTSSNPEVATVTDGVITAVGPGVTVIIAKTIDGGFMAYCTVTVEDGPGKPKTETVFTKVGNYFVFDVNADENLSGKVLIIALYDKNGSLLELANVPQTRELTFTYVVLRENAAARTAKVFLWNDLSDIEPDAPCEALTL